MKRWCVSFLCMTMLLLLAGGSINGIVDPYFHYHKPLAGLEYAIYDERYQNDGIVKHFDYDAILTGTSMTENFKTSEFDALFLKASTIFFASSLVTSSLSWYISARNTASV